MHKLMQNKISFTALTYSFSLNKICGHMIAVIFMENVSFDTDYNRFKCVECGEKITVEKASDHVRTMTCEKCGTEYLVARNEEGGLTITVRTASEPELVVEEEKNMEEGR